MGSVRTPARHPGARCTHRCTVTWLTSTAFGKQLLHVAVRQAVAQAPAHRHTITSARKRHPEKAQPAGETRTGRAADVTGPACLDLPNRQRNGAERVNHQ